MWRWGRRGRRPSEQRLFALLAGGAFLRGGWAAGLVILLRLGRGRWVGVVGGSPRRRRPVCFAALGLGWCQSFPKKRTGMVSLARFRFLIVHEAHHLLSSFFFDTIYSQLAKSKQPAPNHLAFNRLIEKIYFYIMFPIEFLHLPWRKKLAIL